jgi:lysophospholipase L1-like esterase
MMRKIIRAAMVLILVCAVFCEAGEHKQTLKKDDRVIFLGDSITQFGFKKKSTSGFGNLITKAVADAYPDLGIQIIGAGRSGHKVPDCQNRLDRSVLKKKPTIVVIYIGINDVWHWNEGAGTKGTTKERFESGLKDMIAKINAVGARVILCTPTVIGEKTDGTNKRDEMLEAYSEISRKVAEETNTQLLDLRKAFMEYLKKNNPDNAQKGILTRDRAHLNKEGNRYVAELMLEALNVPKAK